MDERYDPKTYRFLLDFLRDWAPELDKFLYEHLGWFSFPEEILQRDWYKARSNEEIVDGLYKAAWRGAVCALRSNLARRRID